MCLVAMPSAAENVALHTPATTLVLDVEKGKEPTFVYYGTRLDNHDISVLPAPTRANWSSLEIYPAYGATHIQGAAAFAMCHADGNL